MFPARIVEAVDIFEERDLELAPCVPRTPMPEAAHLNARWSLDFLTDSFGASRKFRILAVIDDCCRENLCLPFAAIAQARVGRIQIEGPRRRSTLAHCIDQYIGNRAHSG